ncbi:hypothetical protein sos41_02630 [Alphaproteobacteria bacterium SO-S41]|nr:hypothetical protein sos41_02630 [Alphaproteobacteria bacterium SO-S41]
MQPFAGRRESKFVTPVPKARKRKGKDVQAELGLDDADDDQRYNPTPIINVIRGHVASWRALPNSADWGVTPSTARLLQHWRHHEFQGVRPFFCQVEAVETLVWLTEVARTQRRYAFIWDHLKGANEEANPDLFRIALKMATGAGKTTVMAMLIAWQTVNAVRVQNSSLFSRGFLIVAPGITIRDRLRVLLPDDPDNYYKTRELIPADMMGDVARAKIVVTNYHAFKRRETMDLSKVGRSLLQGRGDAPLTIETDGQMLQRACGDLINMKNVVVINDEAHHCYRERPATEDDEKPTAEEKDEAKKNNEAARLWISGLEALKRKVGVRAVYDLSATPFFLRGSGYREGTLFPWTVSDFSLMDAIESGIVKLPRVPVSDNLPIGDMPVYRELWKHIGKKMPKKGVGKGGPVDPLSLPEQLQTALYALYSHYETTHEAWLRAGITTPPVFIVVCNNTSTSRAVYEWISGFERKTEDGELQNRHSGHLKFFQNYDDAGNRLARPNALLIDSYQIESGDALDTDFRDAAGPELEQFKRDQRERTGDAAAGDPSDAEILREVMNTVGRPGRLGESIRCVVSVSMLTEGWDANTVTHILGVRAFGTQLLCEQVVGRGLRRQSYELNAEGLFDVEYADILGIPFDFTAKPVVVLPKAPKPVTRVHAVKERASLEIVFPRVQGYRVELPEERLTAEFTEDSRLVLTPEEIGPTKVFMEGIVGEGVELNTDYLDRMRNNEISYRLASRLLFSRFRDHNQEPPMHLFGQLKAIARRWVDEGYLVLKSVPRGAVSYQAIEEKAVERIYLACQRRNAGANRIKAILDPYNPRGSTRHVGFTTSKPLWKTAADKSHVNYVVEDSAWEGELARVIESHPRVVAYAKNQGMQFEVPYRDGATPRAYVPDFIVRLDDGKDEPINLILETKGYRGSDAQMKAETMKTLWVPGVNNLQTFGRWRFAEFTDVFEIDAGFTALVESLINDKAAV